MKFLTTHLPLPAMLGITNEAAYQLYIIIFVFALATFFS